MQDNGSIVPTATDAPDTDTEDEKDDATPTTTEKPDPVERDDSEPFQPKADNVEQRHLDAYTRANQATAEQFGQQHPFLPSRWAPPAAPEQVQQAIGESDAQQKIAAAQEKEQARQERLSSNAENEAQMRGTGQRFYTDPYGRIQPIVDPESNKALFNSSGKREQGIDPTTKQPAWVTQNKFGEKQYAQPKMTASPDLTDDKLYYDFGNGNQVAAGKASELMNHPNFQVARAAMKAVHQRRSEAWKQALEPMQQIAADTTAQFDIAKQQHDDAQTQIEGLQAQSDALTQNPSFKETTGGVMGIGAKPSDTALQLQNQDNAIQSQIQQLSQQRDQLGEQLKPNGQLARIKRNAQLNLGIFKAKATHDNYSDLAQERRAILKSQGKSEEGDPTLSAILSAQQAYGTAIGHFGRVAQNEAQQQAGGSSPAAPQDAQGQPAPTTASGPTGAGNTGQEPFQLAAQGVKAIGATPVVEIAKRYGDGQTPPTPASLVAMKQRVNDLNSTLSNKDSTIFGKARDSMQKEADYLDGLFTQRLPQLPVDQQRKVADATRDPTLLEKIGGAAVGVARGAGTALTDIGESAARNLNKLPTAVAPGLSSIPGVKEAQATAGQNIEQMGGAMREEAQGWKANNSPEIEQKLREGTGTGVIPEALGGMLPLAAGGGLVGGAAKALGLGAAATTALTSAATAAAGGAQSGNSLRREAIAALKPQLDSGKISKDEYEKTIGLAELAGTGIGAGAAALGPMSKMATRLGGLPAGKTFMDTLLQKAARGGGAAAQKWLASAGRSALADVVKEGVEQTGVGFVQNLTTDLAAEKTFDPNRKIDVGVEAIGAGQGGVAGAILSALTHVGALKGKAKTPSAATSLENAKIGGKEPVAGIDRPYTDAERASGVKAAVDKLGPQPPASSAAESAQAFAPELAEKANTPPPGKSAVESADVFKTEGEKGEVDQKVGAQQEAKAQSLVDQIQEATGKPREDILKTREGKSMEDWTKELSDEAKYQKSPLTVDPDRRISELKDQIAQSDKDWAAHVDKTAAEAENASQIVGDKAKVAEQFKATRARHDDLMGRRDAIQQQLEEAERTRQSPQGAEALKGDLAEREQTSAEDARKLATPELEGRRDAMEQGLTAEDRLRQSQEGGEKLKADLAAKEAKPVEKPDDVIDKLKGAMLLKPEDYSGGKSSSLGIDVAFKSAHDAALHVAIAAVRAGRKIAEVIKSAIAHFKDAFPKATPEQIKTVEDTVREHVGAPAYDKVDIGKRDESVSTGTGKETAKESAMMADWKKQIAAEAAAKAAPADRPSQKEITDEMAKTPPAKLEKIKNALKTEGHSFQYQVYDRDLLPPDVKDRAIQVDITPPKGGPNSGEGLGSTNRRVLAGLGVDIPAVPDSMKQGSYSLDQVKAAIAKEKTQSNSDLEDRGALIKSTDQSNAIPKQSSGAKTLRNESESSPGVRGQDAINEGAPGKEKNATEGQAPVREKAAEPILRTTDKIIKALESAKVHDVRSGKAASADPFSLAWDGAIDAAILSIKAGRKVADVVKMAVGRLKERHPDATEEQIGRLTDTIREHMGETKQTPEAKVLNSPQVEETRSKISKTWDEPATVKQLSEKLSATRDSAETQAGRTASQTYTTLHNELTRSLGKDEVKAGADALAFKVEAGSRGKEALAEMKKKIEESEKAAPKWKERSLAAIDYATKNFDKLQSAHDAYEQFTNHQLSQEQDAGLPTTKHNNYVPHLQDMDHITWRSILGLDPETRGKAWSKIVGLEQGTGGTSPTGADSRKNRTFDTFADSIAAGIDPKSLNALDLLQRRIRTGQTGVNLRAWESSLKGYKDPKTGKPILMQPERVNRNDGSFYYQAPDGYKSEMVGNSPIAVKDEYSGILSALTDPSWLRKTAPTRMLLKANATGKSSSLLVDTFHLGRLALRQSWNKIGSEAPVPSYEEGLTLLEHSPAELTKMADNGEIPKEDLSRLLEKQKTVDEGIKAGLNVGSTSDAMHQELVRKIPILGDLNKFIFDKFSRGAMTEAYVLQHARETAAHPELSSEQIARNVAKDTNIIFGNLGRQGWFKSKSNQDLMRLLTLAPQWNESLIKGEVGGVAQIGKSVVDAVTGRRLAMGMLGRQMVASTAAVFLFNQVLNQITRGHPTWENPEEGIGAKLSAWIPDGIGKNSSGFFLNPLSVSAEIASTLLEKYERTGNTYDPIIQYFRNRASTVTRPLATFFTKTNFLGQKLKPTDVWKETRKDAIPAPISGSAAYHAAKGLIKGGNTEKFQGEFQKQALSTIGLKTEKAPSPEQRVMNLAGHYNSDHGVEKFDGPASDYKDLSDALRRGNTDDIHEELQAILEKKPSAVVERHFNTLSKQSFTGNKDREEAFIRTLTPEQRSTYVKAQKDRADLARKALDALRRIPARERKADLQLANP